MRAFEPPRTLPEEELQGIAFFAAAEAYSQGYDLDDEVTRAHFYQHLRGSAKQYFLKEGVERFYRIATPDPAEPVDGQFIVRAIALQKTGADGDTIGQWAVSLP